ncbi:MAG: VCBS repeat-containing protein [Bifidobacteriaceae bacterium]|jgi:hypothetical protein|nr:VCBS repeat-containing protein [Bifidobacteriaceae bacterium]
MAKTRIRPSRAAVAITAAALAAAGSLALTAADPAAPAAVAGGDPDCGITSMTLSPDLNSDGRGELLTVDAIGDMVIWRFNKGNTLGAPRTLETGVFEDIYGPGDWDGDGRGDVLSISFGGGLRLRSGDGWGWLDTARNIGHGWMAFRMIPAGDLTQDGAGDLLAIDTQGRLWLYSGNGWGGFKTEVKQVGQGWKGLDLYAAGDLNKDGTNDILAVLPDGTLWAYNGRGNGTFSTPKQVGRGWGQFELVAGADLNGDGRADIVGRNNQTGELYYYQGNGGGSFQAAKLIGTGFQASSSCYSASPAAVYPNITDTTALCQWISSPENSVLDSNDWAAFRRLIEGMAPVAPADLQDDITVYLDYLDALDAWQTVGVTTDRLDAAFAGADQALSTIIEAVWQCHL